MNKESIQRILEAFAYIAASAPTHKQNMYNVLKVFYIADKMHMERYGRFIFDEQYSAMPKGPVPSQSYDLMKAIKGNCFLPHGLEPSVELRGHQVVPIKQPDLDLFSRSDLKCIDEVIEISKTQDLGELSHDQAWKNSTTNRLMDVNMILSTLENSKELIELNSQRHA